MNLYFDTVFDFQNDRCKVTLTSHGTFDEDVAKKIIERIDEFINSNINENNILVYGSWLLKVNDDNIRIENDKSYVAISLWTEIYRDILDIIVSYEERKDGEEEKVNNLIIDEWQKEIVSNFKNSLNPEIKELDEAFVIKDDDFWNDSSDNN